MMGNLENNKIWGIFLLEKSSTIVCGLVMGRKSTGPAGGGSRLPAGLKIGAIDS